MLLKTFKYAFIYKSHKKPLNIKHAQSLIKYALIICLKNQIILTILYAKYQKYIL